MPLPSWARVRGALATTLGVKNRVPATLRSGLAAILTFTLLGVLLSAGSTLSTNVSRPRLAAAGQQWGVDSGGQITQDVYDQVTRNLGGTPDFWGRYIGTGYQKNMTRGEVNFARDHHLAILPIWFNFCEAQNTHAWGEDQAHQAIAAAHDIGMPAGPAIFIDLEAIGSRSCPEPPHLTELIKGWVDGFQGSGYKPGFYGHTAPGDPWGPDYCAAVNQDPAVGDSFEWSYYPSLSGTSPRFNKPGPPFAPTPPPCRSHTVAWQYHLQYSTAPVDLDEATQDAPLWQVGAPATPPPPPPPTPRPTQAPTPSPAPIPPILPTATPAPATPAPATPAPATPAPGASTPAGHTPAATPAPSQAGKPPGWPNTGVAPG